MDSVTLSPAIREPAPLVVFDTECGPIPQSAARPTRGSLRKRWNPSGRCDSAIVAESYPLMAEAHTPDLRLAGSERRVAAEARPHGHALGVRTQPDALLVAAGLVADPHLPLAQGVLAALDGDRHAAAAAAALRDALGPDEAPAHAQRVALALVAGAEVEPGALAAEPLQRTRRRDDAGHRAGPLRDRQHDLELRARDAERAVARAVVGRVAAEQLEPRHVALVEAVAVAVELERDRAPLVVEQAVDASRHEHLRAVRRDVPQPRGELAVGAAGGDRGGDRRAAEQRVAGGGRRVVVGGARRALLRRAAAGVAAAADRVVGLRGRRVAAAGADGLRGLGAEEHRAGVQCGPAR